MTHSASDEELIVTVRVPGQHSEPGPEAVAVAESLDLGWHHDLREDLDPDTEDRYPGEAG